jgi:hypothetical protein
MACRRDGIIPPDVDIMTIHKEAAAIRAACRQGRALGDRRNGGLTDPDDAPAAPEHPVSQTGDLWLLGRHRLLCGDSTVATDVERVLGGVEPHIGASIRSLCTKSGNDRSRFVQSRHRIAS